MIRRAFVIAALGVRLIQPVLGAAQSSEDELRMKERVIALSQESDSLEGLRIELVDGSGMGPHSIYEIADGKVVSQTWDVPRSKEKHGERAVTDEEVRALLRELIAKQYWTFEGTRFVPDADIFLFRLYYKDLRPVDYRCDADEYQQSPQRSVIRSGLFTLVSGKLGTGAELQ